jgi:CheY-like chemotaxis protein
VSLLGQLGYRTIEVENAPAALDVLTAGTSVALVFSDVVLPGQTDGLALAHIIAERYPNIPVVLTTGYTRVFETSSEFPVLRKPYQISALGRVVQQSLNPAGPASSVLAG